MNSKELAGKLATITRRIVGGQDFTTGREIAPAGIDTIWKLCGEARECLDLYDAAVMEEHEGKRCGMDEYYLLCATTEKDRVEKLPYKMAPILQRNLDGACPTTLYAVECDKKPPCGMVRDLVGGYIDVYFRSRRGDRSGIGYCGDEFLYNPICQTLYLDAVGGVTRFNYLPKGTLVFGEDAGEETYGIPGHYLATYICTYITQWLPTQTRDTTVLDEPVMAKIDPTAEVPVRLGTNGTLALERFLLGK